MNNQIETWRPNRVEILTAIRRCFVVLRAREDELTRSMETIGDEGVAGIRCRLSLEYIKAGAPIEDTGATIENGVVAVVSRLIL